MIYTYWVVRFVPNVARGEFTNIGLVCGADGEDWAVKFDMNGISSSGNLRSDLRELKSWVRWFTRSVEGFANRGLSDDSVSAAWIEHLRARQANAVQFSPPAPIEAESAADGIFLLFPHLVEREHARRPRTGLTRAGMRVELREAFQHELDFLPGRNLFTQPGLRVGKQRGGVDLARDQRVGGTVLTNTWGFNVATLENLERDIQSWNYLVSRFRNDGGNMMLDARVRRLSGGEPIEVVYDPPKNPKESSWRADIFSAAQEAWEHANVQATPYDEYRQRLRSGELVPR